MKRFLQVFWVIAFCISGVSESKAFTYFLKAVGHPTVPSSWNTSPAGTGANAPSIAGANNIWVFQVVGARSAETITANINFHGTSTVVVGSGFGLTFSGNGATGASINAQSGGTLTLNNNRTYKLQTLNVNSTVVYGVGTTSVTSPRLTKPYGNLRISTSLRLSNSTGTQVSVAGQLIIDPATTLSLTTVPLVMTGLGTTMFSGTGTLFGGITSVLRLSGGNGGNNGTLLMAAGAPSLNTLSLQFSSGSNFITLGSDLTIRNGSFIMQTGGISLNGNDLTIRSAGVRFPTSSANGVFFGNVNSSLHVRATSFTNTQVFFDPTLNNLGSLTYSSTALTMGLGSPLVISDSIAVQAGTFDTNDQLTIEANSGIRGRLARSNGTILDQITVRTFISGGQTDWMQLAAPGVGGSDVSSWDTWYSSNQAFGIPITCSGCFYADTYMPFQSIFGWDENANDYDANVTSSTVLDPGTGYWVYVGSGATVTSDLTVLNTGAPTFGAGNLPLSVSGPDPDHLNLIANPYPSPISWSKMFNLTADADVAAQMHVYSPEFGYRSCIANGVCTGGLTQIIPTGQAFYVSTSAAANIAFNESIKMSNNTTNLSRLAAVEDDQQYLRINVSGVSGNDETVINFDQSATSTFDKVYDAVKLFKTPQFPGKTKDYIKHTTISTKDALDVNYSINSMPPVTGTATIPLLVRVSKGGDHTISTSQLQNYEGGVLLRDKIKGIYHDLEKGSYGFNMAETDEASRFELILFQKTGSQTVSVAELNKQHNIVISQDNKGAYVRTSYSGPTKATISAFNIVGQQIMQDVEVTGTATETYLDLNVSNQVVIIRVTTGSESVVKKIIVR